VLSGMQLTIPPSPHLVFGAGVAGQLPDAVRALGGERAFVVADPGVVVAGLVEPLVEKCRAAGIDVEVFDGVQPNPTDVDVATGLAALRSFGDAVVVAIGGGSAMDSAKCMALAADNEGEGIDYCFHPQVGDDGRIDFSTLAPPRFPTAPARSVVAVPTTSGTASETNGAGIVTDTTAGRKLAFTNDDVRPRRVLLDPLLTVGLPAYPTATCGMDALTHAIEAFTSLLAQPLTDAIALGAIEMVATWLPRAVADGTDAEARAQMMLAAHMAGIAFSSGPLLGLVHAAGHPLSARLKAAHGQTLAVMLPHVMAFNAPVVADKYARVAVALGVADSTASSEDNTQRAIDAVRALSETVGTATTISGLGGTEDQRDVLVEDALSDPVILTTPRPPTRAEVAELYRAAW